MKLAKLSSADFLTTVKSLLEKKLPLRTAFKLKGAIKVIEEEVRKYEETRQMAIKKYAKLKEDGQVATDDKGVILFENNEKKEEFLKELQELQNMDIAVPTVSVTELGDAGTFSVNELFILDGLFVE